jgi:hypothetical protein
MPAAAVELDREPHATKEVKVANRWDRHLSSDCPDMPPAALPSPDSTGEGLGVRALEEET